MQTLSALVYLHVAFQLALLVGLVAAVTAGISLVVNTNIYLRARAGELDAQANFACSENSRQHDRHYNATKHLRAAANDAPRDLASAGECYGGGCHR